MLFDYFTHDGCLRRLCALGSGDMLSMMGYKGDSVINLDENSTKIKLSHCSLCGHPGSKRSHLKDSCEVCSSSNNHKGCVQKPIGFKCDCLSCHQVFILKIIPFIVVKLKLFSVSSILLSILSIFNVFLIRALNFEKSIHL